MNIPTRLSWIALLWALLLTLSLGCKKEGDYGTAPPSDYAYGGEAYGGDGGYYDEEIAIYEFDDAAIEGELAPAAARATAGVVDSRNDDARREVDAAKDTATTTPDLEAPGSSASDEAAAKPGNKRQIIYTARMQVSVYDVEQALARVEALPDRFGGWLHQRQDNQIVLRIPAEHLRRAMAVVAELGVVDSRVLEALDVTAEYTDLDSRIRVLTEIQAQLQTLLKQAKTVEQALEIRRALDAVTMELELARSRMRELAKSIAFSTLIVRIVNRGPAQELPSSNDPFPWVNNLGVEATEYR